MSEFSGLHSDAELTPQMLVKSYSTFHIPGWKQHASFFTPAVREELYNMYLSTPKPAPCPYDLAIHIRRGDVHVGLEDGWNRYMLDAVYENLITDWLAHVPDATVGIYSEGAPQNFSSIVRGRRGVSLELNGDVAAAFHALVTAPSLAVGPSSFSMGPGHISPNNVFFLAREGDWRTQVMDHPGVTIVPLNGTRALWPEGFRWSLQQSSLATVRFRS